MFDVVLCSVMLYCVFDVVYPIARPNHPIRPIRPPLWMVNGLHPFKLDSIGYGDKFSPNPTRSTRGHPYFRLILLWIP